MAGSERLFLTVLLFLGLPSLWAPGPEANRRGNEAYKKGNYAGAVTAYNKAMESLPGERALSYNAGTAFLAQKKLEDALRSLMTASADPRRDVKSRSFYNAGNALFEAKKLPEALSAYRQAVLADPRDMEAKFNYELARLRMQKEQQQNKGGSGQDSKNQQNAQNQDQDQQQQTQQNEDQARQNPSQPEPQPGEEHQTGSEEQKPQPASMLTKQEAERLLDAVKESEMDMLKARLKSNRKKNVDKDW